MKPVPTVGLLLALAARADRRAPDRPAFQHLTEAWTKPNATLDAIARGGAFAEARCSSCHAVEAKDPGPISTAPRLRGIGLRHPVDPSAEAFAEGM